MKSYGISKEVSYGYDEAVTKAREALAKEGFGVLTEIDVKATLKKKIDKDFRKYIILGACNPMKAFSALSAEVEIGLLLPCNVIVYEKDDGKVVVSAIDPAVAMSMVDNEELASLATEVREMLGRVIDALN